MNWRLLVLIMALIGGLALQACREKRVSATTGPQAASPTATNSETASPEATSSEAASPEATSPEAASPEAASPAASGTPSSQGVPTEQRILAHNSYDTEQSWSDPQRLIPLNYQQAQGKRVFYVTCVWCHADATPAGPSNRSNLSPTPPLLNDGETLNPIGDEALQNIITLGGSAMGKSAMMPPWGQTLSQDDIQAVIAYIRAVAEPAYQPPARPPSQYTVK